MMYPHDEITIRRCTNGFMVSWVGEIDADKDQYRHEDVVFESPDATLDINAERIALANVFGYIADHFDLGHKKYPQKEEKELVIEVRDYETK